MEVGLLWTVFSTQTRLSLCDSLTRIKTFKKSFLFYSNKIEIQKFEKAKV